MAGLFMFAGMVMMDRHRSKKEAKRQRKIFDDLRFAELQRETDERLGGCSSEVSTPITSTPTSASGSDFGPPSVTQDRMPSFGSEYEKDSVYREKASRRSTWYGMKKESRPQPTKNASWRSSMLFR